MLINFVSQMFRITAVLLMIFIATPSMAMIRTQGLNGNVAWNIFYIQDGYIFRLICPGFEAPTIEECKREFKNQSEVSGKEWKHQYSVGVETVAFFRTLEKGQLLTNYSQNYESNLLRQSELLNELLVSSDRPFSQQLLESQIALAEADLERFRKYKGFSNLLKSYLRTEVIFDLPSQHQEVVENKTTGDSTTAEIFAAMKSIDEVFDFFQNIEIESKFWSCISYCRETMEVTTTVDIGGVIVEDYPIGPVPENNVSDIRKLPGLGKSRENAAANSRCPGPFRADFEGMKLEVHYEPMIASPICSTVEARFSYSPLYQGRFPY